MTQQRRFTKEFEEEAVRLVQTSGRTQREIAGDLGIGLSTLVRWIGRGRDRHALDPTAAESEVTAELKRLRRENEISRPGPWAATRTRVLQSRPKPFHPQLESGSVREKAAAE